MSSFLTESEIKRAERVIKDIIVLLDLDLTDISVLTEVGSGYFSLTPIIALMAGAKKVFAWTRDSVYGNADDIVSSCEFVIDNFEIGGYIEFAKNSRPPSHVSDADVITNSGFVRPLDEELLASITKQNVVIPLMYEAWEFREGDIDLALCKKKAIPVGGTWESYESLGVFDYCGQLAAKICYEAGLEILGNNIIIWSNDPFGDIAERTFKALGARTTVKTTDATLLFENIKNADFIFFCDYHDERRLIGRDAIIDIDRLERENPSVTIIHLIGNINAKYLENRSIRVYPAKNGRAKTMTFTLAHVGMTPMIKLQAGGLKVAECLYHGIEHPICQRMI